MDTLEIGSDLSVAVNIFRLGQCPLDTWFFELYPLVLSVGKRYKLASFEPKEGIGTSFADLLFPFCDPGVKIPVAALADTFGRSFHDLKKALIVLGGIGVIGLSKELIG